MTAWPLATGCLVSATCAWPAAYCPPSTGHLVYWDGCGWPPTSGRLSAYSCQVLALDTDRLAKGFSRVAFSKPHESMHPDGLHGRGDHFCPGVTRSCLRRPAGHSLASAPSVGWTDQHASSELVVTADSRPHKMQALHDWKAPGESSSRRPYLASHADSGGLQEADVHERPMVLRVLPCIAREFAAAVRDPNSGVDRPQRAQSARPGRPASRFRQTVNPRLAGAPVGSRGRPLVATSTRAGLGGPIVREPECFGLSTALARHDGGLVEGPLSLSRCTGRANSPTGSFRREVPPRRTPISRPRPCLALHRTPCARYTSG